MDVNGAYTFNAPRERVWDLLLDPDALRAALPSCKEFRQTGEDAYEATMSVGIGAVKGAYKGTIRVIDKEPVSRLRLLADGTGRAGFLKGDGVVELQDNGATTLVSYSGTAQVGGMIANVGQRLLASSAQLIIKQFFTALERQLGKD